MTLTLARPARALPGSARSPSLLLLALGAASAACSEQAPVMVSAPLEPAGASGGALDAVEPSGAEEAPRLRGAVELADDELAARALTLLGSAAVGARGGCGDCHAIGRPTLSRWSLLTADFAGACLADTALGGAEAARSMLGCFRARAEPAGAFAAAQFGIYAAAAHLPWFAAVFQQASAAGASWQEEHATFVARAGMPRAGARWSQDQFDEVAEWFARGLPGLLEQVPEDGGEACVPGLDPRLAAHVAEMGRSGWRAANEQTPLLMHGCEEAQRGAACLQGHPLVSDALGERWEVAGTAIRLLHDNSEARSTYWSRSSPDGRYFASGLLERGAHGFSGQLVDLARDAVIGADFTYDPTFFPDNSGFLIQRSSGSGSGSASGPSDGAADPADVAVVCEQSVLAEGPSALSGQEAECTELDGRIGLYQQLAKSLDGDDFWVVFGSYDGDNGGLQPVLGNPAAAFEARSTITLVPMPGQGAGFEPGSPVRVQTPQQGDPMLSPSGRLLVTRVKGAERSGVVDGRDVVTAEQSGYALHLVGSERRGDDWEVQLTDVGRICLQGGKAVVSYDERWLVLHHYVTETDASALGFSGPGDAGFEAYLELGASNLYLVDLLDGTSHVITDMSAGQYALFPHFRSDGWIYFVVRTLDGREYFAASDAALRLEGGGG